MKAVKTILAILAGIPILVCAESDYEAVVDDSVIGYWRFNDPADYNKDSSGHGGGITEMKNNAAGGPVAESVDWARGGGCLELPCSNTGDPNPNNCGSAVATLTSGKTLDMSRTEGGWTVATWIRGSQSLVDAIGSSGFSGDDMTKFKTALGDGKWHPLVVVYRPGNSSDFYHVYVDAFDGKSVADITAGGNDSKGHPAWHIPLTVSNDKVTLGGDIGGSFKILFKTYNINATFFGGLDDCVVIDRELDGGSKGNNDEQEVFRFVRTGETFVYSRGQSGDMFVETENWSNKLPPQPGLAYIIENGYEVQSRTTATFAGKSLSIGRTEKLYGIKSVGGSKEEIVSNTVGKLLQTKADTTMTIDDLILNDGVLTSKASRQNLVANIRVRAPSSNPFQIAVSNGTYTVSGKMLGTGSVTKVGKGTLDLSGLTESTAKVSLSAGTLRLPAVNPTLSGYEDGTLLVDFDENAETATTVAVESSWSGKLKFKLNGTVSRFGRYAAISVPTSVKAVTASDFRNQTECASGMTVRMSVVATGALRTVYVECLPEGDLDGSPVLGFE